MAVFIASVREEKEGGYSVTFHNVPGAITQGDTFEEAVRNARDALDTVIQDRIDHSERPMPDDGEHAARAAKAIRAKGAIPVAILTDYSAKTARVNISLDEALLARIDREAAATGRTRSGFLAEAARASLKSR